MHLYRKAATLLLSSVSIWCGAQTTAVAPSPTATPAITQAQPAKNNSSGLFVIDYRNGLVSVVAEKAELGNLLAALGKKIGASIEVAPDVAREPVVARIGSATPTQALAQLLDGPKLEYIVMGSDDSGRGLQRVVVRKRSTFGQEPIPKLTGQPGVSRR